MTSGSPCSRPPLRVKPHGAPPFSCTSTSRPPSAVRPSASAGRSGRARGSAPSMARGAQAARPLSPRARAHAPRGPAAEAGAAGARRAAGQLALQLEESAGRGGSAEGGPGAGRGRGAGIWARGAGPRFGPGWPGSAGLRRPSGIGASARLRGDRGAAGETAEAPARGVPIGGRRPRRLHLGARGRPLCWHGPRAGTWAAQVRPEAAGAVGPGSAPPAPAPTGELGRGAPCSQGPSAGPVPGGTAHPPAQPR